ncbi:MAG: hypothetical protein K2J29_06725 [Muribaculaceae bacterium]|nr:hypothetical protein [Muribaculaceae bacterium]
MNKNFLAFCILTTLGSTASIYAQLDNRHEKDVVNIVNDDKTDTSKVEQSFKDNAPKTPNDNGLPRFALVGKDGQFYIGIGAQFLGEGIFDWGDQMPAALNFTPSSLTAHEAGNGASTRFAWQSSSIYFNFLSMPETSNRLGVFFKAKFTGGNNSFHVSHVYGKYRGLTIGYTNSSFTDGAAQPMTIDSEGPNGMASLSLFTVYWQQPFGRGFSGALGIDAPSASLTYDNVLTQINQRVPAIPLYLQYAWDGGRSHVRLSGIYRPLQYHNVKTASNHTMSGGGVQLSGMARIAGSPLSVQYDAVYGSGIGNYLQDDNGLGLDAVPILEANKMKVVKSMGLTAGLGYIFSPKVAANLTYSHLSNWLPSGADVSADTYRYGDYAVANILYTFNKFIAAGIEYDYGYRRAIDNTGLHCNRLQAQMSVTF